MSATVEHGLSAEEVMAWIDGELGAVEARAVAAHVEACAECAALAEEFRGASRMMAAWGVGEVPAGMEALVMGAAGKVAAKLRERKPRRWLGRRVSGWNVWAVGGGGAAAALVLLALFVVGTIVVEDRPRHAMKMMALTQAPAKQRVVMEDEKLRAAGEDKSVAMLASSPPSAPKASAPISRMNSDIASYSSAGGAPADVASKPAAVDSLFAEPRDIAKFDAARAARKLEASDSPALQGLLAPMIARTVSLAIAVKDLEAARGVLERVLVRHAGFASDVNATGTAGAGRTYNGTLKVPAGELAQAVNELKALGKVQTETQTGEEVSEQHEDLEVRLKNARETEDRLRGILQQRTGSLSDVLEVEEEISRVRGEIEEMEGQQRGLEHRVAYATVTVELSEGAAPAQAQTVAWRLREAFAEGFRNAGEMIVGLVIFVGENGLAFLFWIALLGVPVGLVWRRYKRMQLKIGG